MNDTYVTRCGARTRYINFKRCNVDQQTLPSLRRSSTRRAKPAPLQHCTQTATQHFDRHILHRCHCYSLHFLSPYEGTTRRVRTASINSTTYVFFHVHCHVLDFLNLIPFHAIIFCRITELQADIRGNLQVTGQDTAASPRHHSPPHAHWQPPVVP